MEALQVLNTLRAPFVVTGVIPTNELKDETEFRRLTGVTFRLIPFNRLHKPFKPNYAPAIYGVSAAGKVLFILPGVPEQQDYLYNLLVNFYGKSRTHLIPGGRKKNGDGG